ncbi:MAG: inositol monophosphatase family protein [Patescibacteria group bacterium]|jgi:myo-inositol-1(or 4)-monophosphatase
MREIPIALQAAEAASRIVRSKFGMVQRVMAKNGNPKDVVTDTDLASEKRILQILRKHFPSYNVHSEEAGIHQGTSEYTWVIDPIDGTTNFSREIPCVSVSIALVHRKRVILGVISNPITNEVYVGEFHKGATRNGKKIHVGSKKTIEKAFVCCEWWSRTPQFERQGIRIFSHFAKASSKIRYISGTVWNLTRVASGNFDIETCDTSFLDIAAASRVITEAGGRLTDHRGKEIPAFSQDVHRIVAANPKLHAAALKELRILGVRAIQR